MRARHFVPLLLALSISLTACGGDKKEPEAGDSPPPTSAELAYYDCLKQNGQPVVIRDSGSPREDKDKPWNEEAHKACESKRPPPPAPATASPERIAAQRKESECLRAEGISWYPDPDPVTGEIDQRSGTGEQWSELKTKRLDALKKCRKER